MIAALESSFPESVSIASVGDIGAIGVLAIIALAIYRYLPKLVDRAMDEHRRSVSEFAQQLRLEREFFERQMALARHDEQQARVVATLERLEREIANR
jgi:hypothetical protein